MKRRLSSWKTRTAVAIGAAAVSFTALMGFAHTKPGRPILLLMAGSKPKSGAASCPLGFDVTATPAQRTAAQQAFSDAHRGAARAHERPAFGFVLATTSRTEIASWATNHHVTCKAASFGSDLDCSDVPLAALSGLGAGPVLSSLWLSFDAQDKLMKVEGVRHFESRDGAQDAFAQRRDDVLRLAGAPGGGDEQQSRESLSDGLLSQSSSEIRYQDYFVALRVTKIDEGNFMLSEGYHSLIASK